MALHIVKTYITVTNIYVFQLVMSNKSLLQVFNVGSF
jgi:hypothetical protein